MLCKPKLAQVKRMEANAGDNVLRPPKLALGLCAAAKEG
jgi:hypothetical protein